jgi:exopolysaccharide biosynthesis protein
MDQVKTPKTHWLRIVGKTLLRFFSVILVTLLVAVILLLGLILLLTKGPSSAARDRFVRSVNETSAIGFLKDIFLSPEEVDAIINPPKEPTLAQTDTSLVTVTVPDQTEGPYTDPWGYVDDDGDGIILVPLKGGSYVGYMLIVLDPSRVVVGCPAGYNVWRGHPLIYYIEENDAVAGINAGGFDDPGGMGDGSLPDTLIVHNGEVFYPGKGVGYGFVGIDSDNILHVGFKTGQEVYDWDIQEGCGFGPGPILVINGEMAPEDSLVSGLNPRSAIGQRSDGAILMLVIEGRQPSRLGATYEDEAEVMLRFGAVNAVNLDGGSSSMMWYNGEFVNNSASVIGQRNLPSSFIVLKEGVDRHGGD